MGEAVALTRSHGVQARELLDMLTGSVFLAEILAHGDGERDWAVLADVSRRRAGQRTDSEH